jgi:predicted DNA-binding transcriptional regulator
VRKPLSKDRAIGGIIFTACFIIAILYVVTLFYPQWIGWTMATTPPPKPIEEIEQEEEKKEKETTTEP